MIALRFLSPIKITKVSTARKASSGGTKTLSGEAMRNPPEPSLPPTAILKPSTCAPSASLVAGVSARSCDSAWVQTSLQAVMVTLNLRGRLVKALWPTKIYVNSRTTREASNSSLGVRPATAQPITPRILSMPVCKEIRSTALSPRQIFGTSLIVNQRS